MRSVLFVGNRPRHLAFANVVLDATDLAALFVMERRPLPAKATHEHAAALQARFEQDGRAAIHRFFGEPSLPRGDFPIVEVTPEQLNGPRVHEVLGRVEADISLSYGVHRLEPDTMALLPEHRWNLHLGLCPAYRGLMCGFWPSYMLEPQMTGMTLHVLAPRIDQGDIIHQNVATMVRGDGVQDLTCRAVAEMFAEVPAVLAKLEAGTLEPFKKQRSGKMWFGRDWRADHLRQIYDGYGDRIVDAYLDGELGRVEPKPHRQLGSG